MSRLVFALFVFAAAAHAEKYQIHSRFDHYDLDVNSDGTGVVTGKKVAAKYLKEVLPLLTSAVSNDCPPLKGAPDATATASGKTRSIYLTAGQVKEDNLCLKVDGDGLDFFPVHRDFLIGPESDGVKIQKAIEVTKGSKRLLNLKKEGEEWTADKKDLNWDFIEQFENSLKNYDVRFRALPVLAEGKPVVVVKIDGQAYHFYKIGPQTWAMQKPKARWLEASDNWSFWYDLDDMVLVDRNAGLIKIAGDREGQTMPARLSAMDKLGATWSPNLRELYLKIVGDAQDSPEIQQTAMRRLRAKPSEATARGLAGVLAKIADENQKKAATQVLKMYYPKGPLYNPSGSPTNKQQVIDFWSNHWSKKP